MSDISEVFEVDDIFTLSDDITASEQRGIGEKNGYSFLCSDACLLIAVRNKMKIDS